MDRLDFGDLGAEIRRVKTAKEHHSCQTYVTIACPKCAAFNESLQASRETVYYTIQSFET